MNQTKWTADQHVSLLIILHWVAAGLFGLLFLVTSLLNGLSFLPLPLFVVPLTALHAAAAMGMQTREPWSRIVSLIAAAISLFSFPLGTAFGVYAIIVHVNDDVRQQFLGAPNEP